jgi:hypothetical protein
VILGVILQTKFVTGGIKHMIRILVIVLLLISAPLFAAQKVPETLGEQLDLDNPRVIKYLNALSVTDIGKKLKGIKLSDRSIAIKNHIYLEKIHSTKNKFTVYIFRNKAKKVAYAWVESNGQPLPIPPCPANSKEEGQYVLSGDIYTWQDVHPGDGVVILECVTTKWINEIKKIR